jgi:hypothetical protein
MSNECIGVADQEGKSMAQHLALAERELSAFVTAVRQLFGAERAWQAGNIWIDELERKDWPSEAPVIDWRKVTIAAVGKACRPRQTSNLTTLRQKACSRDA